MSKIKKEVIATHTTPQLLPGVRELLFAKKKFNGKTGALEETAKPYVNTAAKQTTTMTGAKILTFVQVPPHAGKNERDEIVWDLHRNKTPRSLIATAVGVSETTVHNVLKKEKERI